MPVTSVVVKLWTDDGDVVVVDDPEAADEELNELRKLSIMREGVAVPCSARGLEQYNQECRASFVTRSGSENQLIDVAVSA